MENPNTTATTVTGEQAGRKRATKADKAAALAKVNANGIPATGTTAPAPIAATTGVQDPNAGTAITDPNAAIEVPAAGGEATTTEENAAAEAEARQPGKIEQILQLHKEGKSNKEIVAAGFNKTTVSIQVAKYKKSQEAANPTVSADNPTAAATTETAVADIVPEGSTAQQPLPPVVPAVQAAADSPVV